MSAFGTKQTSHLHGRMSAIGGKADMPESAPMFAPGTTILMLSSINEQPSNSSIRDWNAQERQRRLQSRLTEVPAKSAIKLCTLISRSRLVVSLSSGRRCQLDASSATIQAIRIVYASGTPRKKTV